MSVAILNGVAWAVIALVALLALARTWHPQDRDTDADTATAGAIALVLVGLCGIRLVLGVVQ